MIGPAVEPKIFAWDAGKQSENFKSNNAKIKLLRSIPEKDEFNTPRPDSEQVSGWNGTGEFSLGGTTPGEVNSLIQIVRLISLRYYAQALILPCSKRLFVAFLVWVPSCWRRYSICWTGGDTGFGDSNPFAIDTTPTGTGRRYWVRRFQPIRNRYHQLVREEILGSRFQSIFDRHHTNWYEEEILDSEIPIHSQSIPHQPVQAVILGSRF